MLPFPSLAQAVPDLLDFIDMVLGELKDPFAAKVAALPAAVESTVLKGDATLALPKQSPDN